MGTIQDLRGRTFGRLSIPKDAEPQIRDRHAYWPAYCDCHPTKKLMVRGSKLTAGRIVSCGCYRADPAVRQGAMLSVSSKRRRAIAKQGARARWSG